jgi:catechol 2,3-dioxygenase-like lactoylglutathione lyase family enzyme
MPRGRHRRGDRTLHIAARDCYRRDMIAAVDRLDHIGIVADDLAAAASTYERLGFRLTAEARQSGPLDPGGPVLRWGSANRCAMLRQGYLEIIGIVEHGLYDNELGRFLARYAGIHILALGVADAAAQVPRLRAAGLAVAGIRPMSRPAGGGTARFKRVPIGDAPEGRIQLIEHETPELLWQPQLLEHPNHAVALVETVLCVDDLDAATDRFARLTGIGAERRGAARVFAFARSRLILCEPAALPALVPGETPPCLPWFAGIGLATDDENAAIRAILLGAGIPQTKAGDRVIVPSRAACGTALIFAPDGVP